jgi:hypothetical protein
MTTWTLSEAEARWVPPLPIPPNVETALRTRFQQFVALNPERYFPEEYHAVRAELVQTLCQMVGYTGGDRSGFCQVLLGHLQYAMSGRHVYTLETGTVRELSEIPEDYLTLEDLRQQPLLPRGFALRVETPVNTVDASGARIRWMGGYTSLYLPVNQDDDTLRVQFLGLYHSEGELLYVYNTYDAKTLYDPTDEADQNIRRVVVNALYALYHPRMGALTVPSLGYAGRQALARLAKGNQTPVTRVLTLSPSGRATLANRIVRPSVVESLAPPERDPRTPSGEPIAEHVVREHDHCVWVTAAHLGADETILDQRVGAGHKQLYKVSRSRGAFTRGSGPAHLRQTVIRPADTAPHGDDA